MEKKGLNILNIYLEQFAPEKSKEEVWDKFINSEEFQSLFVEKTTKFTQGSAGALMWRKFIFFNVVGEYEVESFNDNTHLLLKISSGTFSSLLLLTAEENNGGVLLRLDHRSFFGQNKEIYKKMFARRWSKLLKSFESPKQKDK